MKYAFLLLALIALASFVSWLSIYGFWIGIWVFHSLAAARACETIGAFILSPARWLLPFFGNQNVPLFEPKWYAAVNGLLLGIVMHLIVRRILFRTSPRPSDS